MAKTDLFWRKQIISSAAYGLALGAGAMLACFDLIGISDIPALFIIGLITMITVIGLRLLAAAYDD